MNLYYLINYVIYLFLDVFRRIPVLRIVKDVSPILRKYKIKLLRQEGMKIGENTIIYDCRLGKPQLIEIGNNCVITPNVCILVHDASYGLFLGKMKWSKVKILDNCFIWTNTVILPGVIIGPNCIVGANSTVSKDIPPNTICAGSPANVICSIQEFVDKHKLDIDIFEHPFRVLDPEETSIVNLLTFYTIEA